MNTVYRINLLICGVGADIIRPTFIGFSIRDVGSPSPTILIYRLPLKGAARRAEGCECEEFNSKLFMFCGVGADIIRPKIN